MKLTPWRKHEVPAALRGDFEDVFNRMFHPFDEEWDVHLPETFRRRGFPPVNVAEAEDHFSISVELPGLAEDDIQIELMGNQLMIKGERKWKEEKEEKEFHRIESQYGSFQRVIQLPTGLRLDPDAVEAKYEKGMLEIAIPKVEPTPVARIPIQKG